MMVAFLHSMLLVQSSLSNPALVYPEPLPTGALSDETDFFVQFLHLNPALEFRLRQ